MGGGAGGGDGRWRWCRRLEPNALHYFEITTASVEVPLRFHSRHPFLSFHNMKRRNRMNFEVHMAYFEVPLRSHLNLLLIISYNETKESHKL